ncbi:MAG TPA: GspE/PulE family protein [Pirellulales bacterium]|nr:GspE/PulE family protein [Pirellulales bacterium]
MTSVLLPSTDFAGATLIPPPSPGAARRSLGSQLLGAELITSEELEAALKRQSEKHLRLGEALVDLGFVADEQILPYIQRQLGVPAVRLREGLIDPEVVKLLPRQTAEAFLALPLFKVRDQLSVAMAEPQNLEQIDELERVTRLKVRPSFAFRATLERMIARCYEEGFEVDEVTADLDGGAVELGEDAVEVDLESVEAMVEGSPIINLVNYLIVQAIRQKASDIHIEPARRHSIVRFRVDGQLREVLKPRIDVHPAIVSRIKVMARLDIAEHRQPQDGRMHVVVEGRDIDLRVSTLPTVLGEKVVLRVLDRSRVNFNLDLLGFPPNVLADVKQMLARPYGLFLVTGPTGSGKTTTLYSALDLIKSVYRNVVTVEDPVEYQLELINQVQVGESAAMNFADALRSILRQDPDIIMVGEIRDAETAQVAVQAALTGHLVLSTLHTNDSAGAVTRLVDMGVASYKIASALVGVIAQRLVRTVCSDCATSYYPPTELLRAIRYEGDARRQFVRGLGCPKCHDTGCLGRLGIYEVLRCSPELRELIVKAPDAQSIRNWHLAQGGNTLLAEGIRLAEKGRTSLDEVVRVAYFE